MPGIEVLALRMAEWYHTDIHFALFPDLLTVTNEYTTRHSADPIMRHIW